MLRASRERPCNEYDPVQEPFSAGRAAAALHAASVRPAARAGMKRALRIFCVDAVVYYVGALSARTTTLSRDARSASLSPDGHDVAVRRPDHRAPARVRRNPGIAPGTADARTRSRACVAVGPVACRGDP